MNPTVRHDSENDRYELVIGEQVVGVADYYAAGETLVFHHTEIDPSQRGRGLGAVLVRSALDDVRRAGRRVDPTCWYVAEFIAANPDYQDLVAA